MMDPQVNAITAAIKTAAAATSFITLIMGFISAVIALHNFSTAVFINSVESTNPTFIITINHSKFVICNA